MVCEIFAVKRRNSAQRGANCHPDQIVVVGGMQQAMLACALALINEGEVAWIEDLSNPLLRTSRAPLS
jgi:DNA-binding transcriptional MocR family regulator